MFTLRFDMRAPDFGAPIGELYAAAIDMCAWAEDRGALLAVLSEHHGTNDGHLPSPIVLASAIAARTERLPILLAALVLPFYDPVRLAEDLSVLDIISTGRVSYVLGVGHRPEEYAHFGIDMRRRGRMADDELALLIRLLAGEEVVDERRSSRVTPSPTSEDGPQLLIGGGSIPAARRAGRFGLGLIAQTAAPGMNAAYEEASREAGHEPGFLQLPDPDAPTAVFVAEDVDRAWDELGPHLLHDAMTAASYRHGDETVASISAARSVDELRDGGTYRVLTIDEAAHRVREGAFLQLLPLCGGLPPTVAWPYLERAADAVSRAAS
jgi:alkanesulfonate monooxygenase SsuD/methylene tetrahydromethanopterin reductase-like flavin-dependent oxidoreductase (luciferase family)